MDYCIKNYYRPGMVYSGIRISNKGVMEIIKLSSLYNLKQGVIINKKYVNDLLPLFDNDSSKITYDEKSLMTDIDYTDYITGLVTGMKFNYDIEYFNTPELFIIVGNDENTVKFITEKIGNIQDVLDFSYYDVEEEMDEMQLAPGIVMKGNFSKIGNIGGTEIIGVGAGSGNSVLDQLAKEDAMEKLNKIFGNSNDEDEDEDEDDGDNGNNGGNDKIDCNDPNFPNRSVLERIFASKEWTQEKYLPKNKKYQVGGVIVKKCMMNLMIQKNY